MLRRRLANHDQQRKATSSRPGRRFRRAQSAFLLRSKLGDRVDITLVSDKDEFLFKPNTIYIPFGGSVESLLIHSIPSRQASDPPGERFVRITRQGAGRSESVGKSSVRLSRAGHGRRYKSRGGPGARRQRGDDLDARRDERTRCPARRPRREVLGGGASEAAVPRPPEQQVRRPPVRDRAHAGDLAAARGAREPRRDHLGEYEPAYIQPLVRRSTRVSSRSSTSAGSRDTPAGGSAR